MTKFCRAISSDSNFQSLILFAILATALSLGFETVPYLADNQEAFFYYFFCATQALFAFEIAVRLGAHAPKFKAFFKDPWNTFDFIVVAVSFLPGIGSFALIARLLRLLRVLRLFSVSGRMRAFIDRLKESFDEAVYAAIVALVLSYIFAIAGFYLFSEIEPAYWGTLGRAALSVFYLLLLQNVQEFIGPAILVKKLHLVYFLLLYFTFYTLALSTFVAAVLPSRKTKN